MSRIKSSHFSIPVCLLFQFFLFGNAMLTAQQPENSLWQKAVEIAGKNEQWVPGILLENELVWNEDGEMEEKTNRKIQFFLDDKGALDAKLIQTLKDGKDITAEERKEMEGKEDELKEEENENPFAPHLQKSISLFSPQLETEWLEDLECVAFHYRQQASGVAWQGTAWLEKTTGIPIKIHFKTDETAKEAELTINRLTGAVLFKHDDPLAWYPLHISYNMDISLKVSFFYTFKGKVENKVSLREYFSFYNN